MVPHAGEHTPSGHPSLAATGQLATSPLNSSFDPYVRQPRWDPVDLWDQGDQEDPAETDAGSDEIKELRGAFRGRGMSLTMGPTSPFSPFSPGGPGSP